MRWTATGFESSLAAFIARLAETPWPGPPEGFRHLDEPRPMRAVLAGRLPGAPLRAEVVVKWSRPDSLADRISRGVRGGKGVREGRVLRALRKAGIRVPDVLAYADDEVDLVVTGFIDGLQSLPRADNASPALLEDVATLLALAHAAGLRHRDLHADNLALTGRAPILVDLGSARMGRPLGAGERTRALAGLELGLMAGARRSQRLRALIHYTRQIEGGDGRAAARALLRPIEAETRRLRRSFWRGRDRRATRGGTHFEVFATERGVQGVRNRDATDSSWITHADAWLQAPPDGATPLKTDGSVLRAGEFVFKRYEGVATGRLPRPIRAFRLAYALRNRGLPAPQPLLAVAETGGAGLYVAEWIDAPNLHDFAATGRLAALTAAERRRLLEELGRTLRRMHAAEVTHRDLKAPNLLVRADLSIVIADLDGARVRRGPVTWSRRARDLMRLDASLDLAERDRLHLLAAYHGMLPTPPVPLDAWGAEIATLTRRKRGPSGRPR
ncbi:MAG: phosphotransferase [Planctomycetota bacterium]|nr:phosphotransferase [Planctomycetota bacterium]